MTDALQLVLNGLAVGCIYGLVALGFVLIYKASEVVNFAQGDLLMLGAFFALTLIQFGLDYWTALAVSILATALVGAFLDFVFIRRIMGQPHFATIMLTLGLGLMIRSAASITWGPETRTLPNPFSQTLIWFQGVSIPATYLSIIVGTLVLCTALYCAFSYTRIGVALQACAQNQLAAAYMGIPVKRMLSLIWGVSAASAAVAGILLAPVSLVDVTMGGIGLKAFAAAVLGGFGSIPGALVGGILIGLMEMIGARYLQEIFRDIAPYVLLLAVLAFWPQGLFGAVARKKV